MPREVTSDEWAEFLIHHSTYAREPDVAIMEHVDNETKEVLARVIYDNPKKYIIYPEAKAAKCGYICFFNGQKVEIWAKTLYEAQEKAIYHFDPPKSKRHMVSVVLAEKGGNLVTHKPGEL